MSKDRPDRYPAPAPKERKKKKGASPAHVEELLDEALEESFPASDPVAVHAEKDEPAR